MSISLALRIAALVCFILACLGLSALAGAPLIPLGLACWVASTLP
jgi:hypothetical protein